MISSKLEDFLSTYCNADEDPAETAELMRGELGAYERPWLLPELDAVIAGRVTLSPDLAGHLTSRRFDSPQDVIDWLVALRTSWYGAATA